MEILERIYNQLSSDIITDATTELPENIRNYINTVANRAYERKGVYTVLVTLLLYKYGNPKQDIRLFQTKFEGGFSARSFDTKHVTPVLKKIGFPAPAESGWLTRSLEQPYPYDFSYKGAIPKYLKIPFLTIVDYVQKKPKSAYNCLVLLLQKVKEQVLQNQIKINPLTNPDKLTISKIMDCLKKQFFFDYGTHHGAKLPVLAVYSIYNCLIKEVGRYKNCHLKKLSSLTASDRTNKSSGDIEIFSNEDDSLYESIEIKLDKEIDLQIIRVVKEKIFNRNPKRYYVLSGVGIKETDIDEIENIVKDIKEKHGCQLIVNGLLTTMKYYLRIIDKLEDFINNYSAMIEQDTELQKIHKDKWNELLQEITE